MEQIEVFKNGVHIANFPLPIHFSQSNTIPLSVMVHIQRYSERRSDSVTSFLNYKWNFKR